MSNFTASVVALLLACVHGPAVLAGPQIEHWQTANGASVYFVAAPEIPMIDVRIVFDAGSARDGQQPGLANLTNDLLLEGTTDLDADAFNRELGRTGARLGSATARDMAYLNLRTLADPTYATPALALLRAAVGQPRFEPAALERVKARTMMALRHKAQSPAAIADDVFYAQLYPAHPYGSPTDGTPQSLPSLTHAEVVAFHARHYVARNAVIAIVGAIDRAAAETIAADLSAVLRAGEAAPDLPAVTVGPAHEERVEFPSIQSHVRVGLPGISRGDPDYFPLLVGNHALGGNSLVSMLFREIRSNRGLSYSAYSYFMPMAEAGPFVAVLQTDRSQEVEALRVLRETIATFVADGPPTADLEAARQNLIGGFPLRVDSNDKIIEYIAMLGFYGLPLDYLDTFTERVASVTAAQVKDAFARRLTLDKLVTVVVGRTATDG